MRSSRRSARMRPSCWSVAMTKRCGWPSLHERLTCKPKLGRLAAQFLAGLDPGSQHDWLRTAVGEPS